MRRLFYLFVALPLVFAACTEQPDDNPAQKEYKLVITSNKVMEFPAEGGEGQIEWEWQEVTRLSSAEPTLTTEAEWIACGQGSLFFVAKNEGEPREAVIRFELFGQVEEVVVKQSGVERAEGVVFEAQMLRGSYFGDEYSEDGNYYICLTDNGFEGEEDFLPNSTYYYVDLYGELFDGQSDGYVTLPLGEYVLDASNSSAAGTFSAEYSEWYKTGATDVEENEYYESGNLVVTAEGVTLTVVICGVQHTVTYSGSLAIVDARGAGNDVARHFAAEYAVANYMGDYYNPGVADNFTIVLSDLGLDENGWELPDASYYLFDLYTEVVDGELRIPHGTYSFDLYDTCLPNTIGASFTRYILMDQYANDYLEEIYFVEGTLTVDADGIVADLVAEDGTHHNVTFEGVVTNIADYSDEFGGGGGSDEILSTLWEDWYCNFSGCSMDYTWYGDYYDVGYDNWFLYLMPNGDVGDGLQLDLLSNDVGLYELSGEYVISNSLEKFTAYPGYANGDYMEGSWYFNADLTQYAPLVEGDIYITNNGDTTFTIEIDAYDDAGNNIYGSWTGVDPNQAQTFAAKRGAHHGLKNKSLSPAAKLMHKR